jgi:hypothetical protein
MSSTGLSLLSELPVVVASVLGAYLALPRCHVLHLQQSNLSLLLISLH